MKSKNFIYIVKEARFDIEGEEYDVSSASMLLSKNSIPTCNVGIAPGPSNGDTNVHVFDLKSLKSTFDKLSRDSTELKKCNLTIELEIVSPDGKGSKQKLEVKDWVLAGVGLSEVSTTGPFDLVCSIMHPAYLLTTHVGFYFDASGTLNFDKTCQKVKDPVQAAEVAIETMETANQNKIETAFDRKASSSISTPLKDPSEFAKELKKAMENAKKEIRDYLVYDEQFSGAQFKLPCEDILTGEYKRGLQYAIADLWASASNQSLWSALVGEVCPEMMLEVIPTYYEKQLHVVPVMPWKKPSMHIYDYDTAWIELPGKDPDPVYGCIMYNGPGATPVAASFSYAKAASEKTGIQPANLSFIPAQADSSVGTLIHCSDPSWISVAAEKKSASIPTNHEATGEISYKKPQKKSNAASGTNKDLEKWNAVRILHLNNMFMRCYRAQVTASMSCPFFTAMHDDGDNPLIPGIVASFYSEGDLFSGEIETVQHNIDCARSVATTNITMSYCQSPDAHENVLGSAPKCPFYQAHG